MQAVMAWYGRVETASHINQLVSEQIWLHFYQVLIYSNLNK